MTKGCVEKTAYLNDFRSLVRHCHAENAVLTSPAVSRNELRWATSTVDLDRERRFRRHDDEQMRAQRHLWSAADRYASHATQIVVDSGCVDHSHLDSMAMRHQKLSQCDDVDLERLHQVVEICRR